ncbi:MAG: nitrite reductase small subunit [Actinomycetota bacterium]|jgi:nitrite reductase (NADH) small subunit
MTITPQVVPVRDAPLLDTPPVDTRSPEETLWTTVCDLEQLEPLWGEAALIGDEQVALFLLPDGRLFAVSNRDPATGSYVMSRGIVGSRGERPTIASPLHKQVFALENGDCLTDVSLSLQTFPIRVRGRSVQIGMPRPGDRPNPD